MLTIRHEQFDELQKGYFSTLAYQFRVRLINDGCKNPDKEVIERIMHDCIKFHIKDVEDVFQYVKIAITSPELQVSLKPDWARNILYTNGTPKARINALKRYISNHNE